MVEQLERRGGKAESATSVENMVVKRGIIALTAEQRWRWRMSDLIDRQDAIDALKVAYWDKEIQSAKDDPCIVDAMTDWAIRRIKELQSARPTGMWIKSEFQNEEDIQNDNYLYNCSECGHGDVHARTQEVPYCWWCGCRMKGGVE